MPLYIAQSGDLDRCYRCLTDWLTTLKDRATQLLINYKIGALVTQFILIAPCDKNVSFWQIIFGIYKTDEKTTVKRVLVHKIWIYEVWQKPSWEVRKTRHQEKKPWYAELRDRFSLRFKKSFQSTSWTPWFVPIESCFTAFWIVCIKTSNPCWAQRAPSLGVCSSKQFWELRADQKLIKKENTWLLILTRPDPDWRQQVDSTPNNQANTP